RDTGDAGLSGWTIYLDANGNGVKDTGEASAVTDANGQVTFSVTPGASQRVCEVLQSGWHNSDPGSDAAPCKTIPASELNSGDTPSRLLGNYRNATITVTKYEDNNANGLRDTGDAGLSAFPTRRAADRNGVKDTGEASAVTDANGQVTFSVTPGASQRVCEVLQSGWHN